MHRDFHFLFQCVECGGKSIPKGVSISLHNDQKHKLPVPLLCDYKGCSYVSRGREGMGGWGDFSGHFSILLEPITKAFSKFAKNLRVIDFRLSFFCFSIQ